MNLLSILPDDLIIEFYLKLDLNEIKKYGPAINQQLRSSSGDQRQFNKKIWLSWVKHNIHPRHKDDVINSWNVKYPWRMYAQVFGPHGGNTIHSPDNKNKIYSPFYQTDIGVEKGGLGLGLSIVKDYVNLLGGDIDVESKVDKGRV